MRLNVEDVVLTKSHFVIEIEDTNDFKILLEYDRVAEQNLEKRLSLIDGVLLEEFDPMFGPYIFITIEADSISEMTKADVAWDIDEYLLEAKNKLRK